MRRHALITLLAGLVTASSLPCYAQQPANALIGFLSIGSSASSTFAPLKGAFIQGLNERGFIEGRNVAIEYRWAEGRYDRLPGLANELIARKVAVIVASGGLASAQQAKAATDTVPILFIASFDPVAVGLTNSMSHPSGNATGVTVNATELAQKRLEFLHRLVPTATTVGALVNPKSASGVVPKIEIARVEAAARLFGLRTVALEASSEAEIEAAFLRTEREGVDALTVSGDAFFTSQRALIVALAKKYRIPAVYPWREYVEAGGLASFGPTLRWAYHQVGLYAARILTGAKLSDMPVLSPTTFETTISRSTAEALGLRLERRLFALTSQYIEELQ